MTIAEAPRGNRTRAARIIALGVALALYAGGAVASNRAVDEHQAAPPNGTVEIINVAGSVIVTGWDQNAVSVTGQVGDGVERVELTSSGDHTTVHVVLPEGMHWHNDGSAHLTIHVPKASALNLSLVSADANVSTVSGSQQIRTVSGDVTSDGGGAAHINTVSGDVHMSAAHANAAEIQTISGDVTVSGAGGDVSIQTVSGGGALKLEALDKFRLHTVSGDFTLAGRLGPAADFEAESVSGDLHVDLGGAPAAEFDLQTLSGDISNCNGPKPTRPEHGPGERLSFRSGEGKAMVRMSTKSGDLSLCAK